MDSGSPRGGGSMRDGSIRDSFAAEMGSAMEMRSVSGASIGGMSMEPTFTTEQQVDSGVDTFLTSSATDSMSGSMRKLIQLVDPEKWPRLASALTEGSAGLTR